MLRLPRPLGLPAFLLIASCLATPRVAAGQAPAASSEPTVAKAIDLKVEPKAVAAQDERPRFGPGWDNHPMFWLGGLGRVDFRLRLQTDFRSQDVPLSDGTFFWALRRIGFGGQLKGGFDFEVTREIDLPNPWRDVFVNFRRFPAASVQAGKFKMPFGLDQLTGATANDFIFRSRVGDQLSPGRDRGVMVHGRLASRRLGYQVGVFEHDGGNARSTDPTRAVAGASLAWRVVTQPWLLHKNSMFSTVQFGVNATNSDVDGGDLGLRGRTTARAVFFAPRLPIHGYERRAGADIQWKPGPFSLQTEWVRAGMERRGVLADGGDAEPVVATGWYVSGTWLVTGGKKAAGGDAPPHEAFTDGIGAIEIAGRVEALGFESGTAATPGNAVHVLTAGATWYVNRWVKTQFNIAHESLDDPLQGPLPSHDEFWTRVVRLQFRF